MSTELSTLPLPPSALRLLGDAGFETVGDLDGLPAAELAEDLGLSLEDASALLLQVRTGGHGGAAGSAGAGGSRTRSALELLTEERHAGRLITFVPELDRLLGGGVALKQLTEFAGVPGVGKTQLATQLALNCQIPAAFGGLDADAIYIDTEGSFMAARALQMAGGLVRYLQMVAARDQSAAQAAVAAALEPRRLLDGIHYFRVHDAAEQIAVIRSLPSLLGGPRPVRLVVVDSIAFHLRVNTQDYGRRMQMMGQMAQLLSELSTTHSLATVLTNQVTTKVNNSEGSSSSSLVPALGDSWAHMCNVQLMVQWHDAQRVARLYKGGTPGAAAYVVADDGVRAPGYKPAGAPPPHGHEPRPGAKRPAAALGRRE